MTAWSRAERLALLAATSVAALHLARFRSVDHALDDAWISFRIARNLLQGQGLTYNAGLPPVEGMTNLSWTLLSAVWIRAWPDLDPIAPARLVGGLCQLGAVLGIGVAARGLARREGATAPAAALAVLVAAGLAALSGSMAFHATSGLETGLWALLVAASVERALAGQGLALGALLGLAFATRPEAGLLGPLLIALLALGGHPRQAARAVGLFALAVAGVEVFRLWSYGALVPNTFHAKAPTGEGAWEYALRWLWLAGGGGLGLLALVPAAGRPRLQRVLAVALCSGVGAVLTGGDWMPGLRRLTEASLLLYLGAGVGLALARGPRRILAAVGVAALAGSSLLGAWRGTDSAAFPHALLAGVGRAAAATPGVDCVAAADIGRLGWEFPGEIYDFAGLVDARIARGEGGHGQKEWDEEHFRARAPDLVLLRVLAGLEGPPGAPLELRTLDLPALRALQEGGGYRAWRAVPDLPGQHTVLLVRQGLELPARPWGPPDPALGRRLGLGD